MAKSIGYLLLIIGLIIIAFSFKEVQTAVKITLPETLPSNYLLIGGGVIFVIGALMSFSGKKRTVQGGGEVPIYRGNQVIGYRRQ